MARLLARSGRHFIGSSLGAMNQVTETPFSVVRDAVSSDPEELEPTKKVLKVLVMQKHAIQTGEGESATYRLTESGAKLLESLGV